MRLGPLEVIVLALLAVALAVTVTLGNSTLVVAAAVGTAVLLAAFLSTPLSLYILVFSMLLGPEFVAFGGGGGATTARGVTLRFDDLLLLIIGFAWLVKSAIHKQESLLKGTSLNGPIMLYVVACSIGTVLGVLAGRVKPLSGFFFNLKYFEYFFLYFMVVNAGITEKEARGLVIASFVTCLLVSLYAIAQIPTGQRVSAPFEGEEGEPNTLGGYLVLMLSIAGGLLVTRGAVPKKWPLVVLMGIGGIALLATLSRSSFLAVFVIVLVVLLQESYKKPILFALLLCLAVSSPVWAPDAVKERIAFTFTQSPKEKGQIRVGGVKVDTSTSDRVRQWQKAEVYLKEYPLFGTGVTGAGLIDAMYPRVLSEVGLVGFMAFALLCWKVFMLARECLAASPDPAVRGLARGFLLGFLGLLIHALASATFIIVRIMEPFWLYAAIIALAVMQAHARQAAAASAPDSLEARTGGAQAPSGQPGFARPRVV